MWREVLQRKNESRTRELNVWSQGTSFIRLWFGSRHLPLHLLNFFEKWDLTVPSSSSKVWWAQSTIFYFVQWLSVRLFVAPWTVNEIHGIFQARILEWVAICFSRDYFVSFRFSEPVLICMKHFLKWLSIPLIRENIGTPMGQRKIKLRWAVSRGSELPVLGGVPETLHLGL